MNKKDRMKRAVAFSFKRTFKPNLLLLFFIILYIGFVALSAFAREPVGHEDYLVSSIFTYMGTGWFALFIVLSLQEMFASKYIRVSPCYKELHTVAIPVTMIVSGIIAMAGAVILNLISLFIGNIDIVSFSDSLIFGAAGVAMVMVLSGIHFSGAFAYMFIMAIFFFSSVFQPDFLRFGFGLGLEMSIVVAVALIVVSAVIYFALSQFSYKRRDSKPINASIKYMETYSATWGKR